MATATASMVGSLTLPVDRGSKLADVISSVTDKASTQITTFRTDIAGASVPQTARVLKAASSMCHCALEQEY